MDIYLFDDAVREDIKAIVEMIFRITEELYVLYHRCVVVFGQLCALDSCGVEADGLVMGDAVAERILEDKTKKKS